MSTASPAPESPRTRLSEYLTQLGLGEVRDIHALPAEASSRRYTRIFLSGEPQTVILCRGLPVPYEDQDGFLELSAYFAKRGLPVPEVLATLPQAGAILLSDAGKSDLSEVMNALDTNRDAEERRAVLHGSLQILSVLQGLEAPELVRARLFDEAKLKWEMDFLFSAIRGLTEFLDLPDPVSFEMQSFAYQSCQKLDQPDGFVICHRDFHARNLMLQGSSKIVMIDYQDARMGLPVYDLVSLLYDPYTPLTKQERDWARGLFWKKVPHELQQYDSYFYLQAMQRLLKALGSYLHLIFYKGHKAYLPSVPMALRYLEEVAQLGHLPDCLYLFIQQLGEGIVPHLPESLGKGRRTGTEGASVSGQGRG